ncbi:MAG: helicase-related protein [bacterium]|nr:helicase-related protein [bacterium]
MTDSEVVEQQIRGFDRGQRIKLPGSTSIDIVQGAIPRHGFGWDLYIVDVSNPGSYRMESLTDAEAEQVEVIQADGAALPKKVIAGLWAEWMLDSARSARSTVLASVPLRPFPHQMEAVYGHMLRQPLLRFLLADEPGTGKTIMSGLWLRESQRLGRVKRCLVVCPAHLVSKWQADFERFFGGGLREVTSETIRQQALAGSEDDIWVVSLNLAAGNPAVREALLPENAGWDAIIFDEAHRMTPTAETFHRVGQELAKGVPNAVFLTATPHRGDEWYFRELLHLVDPDVFPSMPQPAAGGSSQRRADGRGGHAVRALSPGPLHFLRRMKEELVDYDTKGRLFKEREAHNIKVQMSSVEQRFYDAAQDLVHNFFEPTGRQLAAMVYGKRAASSLHALAETLRRRAEKMGTGAGAIADGEDDVDEDVREAHIAAAGSLDTRGEKHAIAELLAQMERAGVGSEMPELGSEPSKWVPMMECLDKNGIAPGSGQQLVVFTEYADTANWLVDEFRKTGFTAERYSGADDHEHRTKLQADFMGGGFEVIVSTDAGNEGIDLQAAHVLINWDIPWSLVRLEQRMGRIHRIGQEHKVLLYNLVARGTREGDAHWRLLERLVEAANELGGKMFDSLAAIMELARSESRDHERLMHLFYGSGTVTESEFTIPTVDEIRRARDEYYDELRSLSSEVDVATANVARNEDRIARVNPIIVERFLSRVEDGALITLEKSPIRDEGFYYISEPPGSNQCGIVEALGASGQKALVATRADLRQQAADEGTSRAAESTMLGPSNPAFSALVTTIRDYVSTEMWQGAVLCDPTVQDDYTLFIFECDITEGADGSHLQSRMSARSWLILVDQSGRAHRVSWEILPNLTPAPHAIPIPLNPRVEQVATKRAAQVADAERDQRANQLSVWRDKLSKQLEKLPNALTKDIKEQELRLSERQRIRDAIENRLKDAADAAKVSRGEVRRVGWAHVLAAPNQPDPEGAEDEQANSEVVSMQFVTSILEDDGWTVQDVHTMNCGYDLHAVRGAEQRCVEVKGRAGQASSSGISLTGGELLRANQLGEQYWLYVVDNCIDGIGQLFGRWQNPVAVFEEWLKDVPVYQLAGSKLKQALGKQAN